jgi:putative oxidoreductase
MRYKFGPKIKHMKNPFGIAQFILRLALGAGFILPVMDRLGLMGPPGSGAAWGDWKHFVDYTNTILPFASRPIANIMSVLATIAEFVFGTCLIIGFRIKETSLGAAGLTLSFGLCMAIFVSIGAPFSYPVFVFTGAALVLSGLDHYQWSIDNDIKKLRN